MALTAGAGDQPVVDMPRDRFGRPLVVPRDGGKPRPYTRASTLGKALDDGTGLQKWLCRMTAIGVASRRDLVLAVNAHRDDKRHLGEIVEQAQEAAQSKAAATTGTALHDLCDQYDRGLTPYVPEEFAADVAAYRAATAGLEVVDCEVFCVEDEIEVAGTYDNTYRLRAPAMTPDGETLPAGTLVVGDKKTGGTIDFGHAAWSVQLATYSRATRFDIAAQRRVEGERVNQAWGLIVHVPAGQGTAQLYWIDLHEGWRLARMCVEVRAARKVKTMRPATLAPEDFTVTAAAATSVDELKAAAKRANAAGEWTDVVRAAFTARRVELTGGPVGVPA